MTAFQKKTRKNPSKKKPTPTHVSPPLHFAYPSLVSLGFVIMSVGVPIKLLHEASPHIVTLELRTGDVYRGTLSSVEDNMNVQLKRATLTRRDGKVMKIDHIFIRGSKIRLFILPDILASAPMFKRVEALSQGIPLQARGLGRGRGVQNTGRQRGGGAAGRNVRAGR